MKNPNILGAICGDTIGSIYEFNPTKQYNFELLNPKMTYTDDSIITIAVADWILNDTTLSHKYLVERMRFYGQQELWPMGGYGGNFLLWLTNKEPKPYNSWGNGSAMRVSPVGFAFETMEATLRVAKITAEVTHNHPEGIKGAQATAAAIYLARTGNSKNEIKSYIENTFGYDLSMICNDIRPNYEHMSSCQETVPQSIIAFLESKDYEDAIRLTVSLGGDADTMGAITGAIAAAYYDEIPDSIVYFTTERMPKHLLDIIEQFNKRVNQ